MKIAVAASLPFLVGLSSCSVLDQMTTIDDTTERQAKLLASVERSLSVRSEGGAEAPGLEAIVGETRATLEAVGSVRAALTEVGEPPLSAQLRATRKSVDALARSTEFASLHTLQGQLDAVNASVERVREALQDGEGSIAQSMERVNEGIGNLSVSKAQPSLASLETQLADVTTALDGENRSVLTSLDCVSAKLDAIVTNTDSLLWAEAGSSDKSILADVSRGTNKIAGLVPDSPLLVGLLLLLLLLAFPFFFRPTQGPAFAGRSEVPGTITILAVTAIVLYALHKGTDLTWWHVVPILLPFALLFVLHCVEAKRRAARERSGSHTSEIRVLDVGPATSSEAVDLVPSDSDTPP